MYLYLMRPEIEIRIKHDKLLSLTNGVRTREMCLRKMELLRRRRVKRRHQGVKSTYEALPVLKARARVVNTRHATTTTDERRTIDLEPRFVYI